MLFSANMSGNRYLTAFMEDRGTANFNAKLLEFCMPHIRNVGLRKAVMHRISIQALEIEMTS